MHELSVTEHILNIALKHAAENQAVRVTDLYITVGRLSSIVDDSIQFYWDIISDATICKGAQLHFNRIPAQIQCDDCATIFTLESELTPCPECSSTHLKILTGEEFFLDSIEIEKEPIL